MLQYCKILQSSINHSNFGYNEEKIKLNFIARSWILQPLNKICNLSILNLFVLKQFIAPLVEDYY